MTEHPGGPPLVTLRFASRRARRASRSMRPVTIVPFFHEGRTKEAP